MTRPPAGSRPGGLPPQPEQPGMPHEPSRPGQPYRYRLERWDGAWEPAPREVGHDQLLGANARSRHFAREHHTDHRVINTRTGQPVTRHLAGTGETTIP